jgi:sensor histidine kinase YesM
LTALERIPKIWKTAFLLICSWYALNYVISAIIEWQVERPYNLDALTNGFYLLEAVCISIALIFLYSNFLTRFRLSVQIAGHIGGLIVYFLFISYLSYYFNDYLDGRVYFDDWKEYMLGLLSWDAMRYYDQYLITVAVFYIIRYFTSLQIEEKEKSGLELKNKEMQISLLKSQINPHFLFNTLNSISTLVGTNKEKARRVIGQLSDVFRYALESHDGMMVKLSHELEFIENYIRIQEVRFGERLRYVKDVTPSCLNMDIPPMILQPLVENSVKYGIAPKDEGGTITLTVRPVGDGVLFRVSDDGLGKNAKKVLDGNSTGVGINNTNRRLQSIYGRAAGLNIQARDDGYSVSFTIPNKWIVRKENKLVIMEKESIN